jgi:sugar lactone lactonase YvrE
LGESPVWDSEKDTLWWIDADAGHLWSYRTSDLGATCLVLDEPTSAVALRSDGRVLVALESDLALVDTDTGSTQDHSPIFVDANMRFNDGKVDKQGRFWVGSKDKGPGISWSGRLYRCDPDGTVTVHLSDLGMSNGLDWSPDGRVMYHVDSPDHVVRAYDFLPDDGSLSNDRVFAQVPSSVGIPDGLTVDVDGCVWLAIWGAGQVRRYAPDGRLDTIVSVPARYTTSCAFGGTDLDQLFITSAASPEHAEAEPLAGAVFVASPRTRGVPSTTCTVHPSLLAPARDP